MSEKLATIFGASGFVGTQLTQALARRGYRVRAAVRRPDLAGHLRPLGMVGQIQPIQANVRDEASVRRAVAGAEVVVNLVGVLFERGRQRFDVVHTRGAANIAKAARQAGVARLVHVSAIGATDKSESLYARSKALGEAEMLAHFTGAVIVRPSIVFGQGDSFFNRFAGMARLMPVLPLIAGDTRFQPVYVGDVATALANAADGMARPGKIYELGGPEVESFRELMRRMLRETGRGNWLLPIPMPLARLIALPAQILPNPPITPDQLRQLQYDNVVSEHARRDDRTLAGLGVNPTAMGAILPSYLWRFRRQGQFSLGAQPPEGV